MRALFALFALLFVASPGLATAQAFLENFDSTSAPCNFVSQTTPANNYTSGGVTLSNAFEVLDECGNFGVSGYSAPNFLAWNTCCTATTETLTFAAPASSVSIRVGSSGSPGVTATALDSGGNTLQTLTVTASSSLQTLSFSVSGISSVQLSVSGSAGVFDDLSYVLNTNDAPTADAGGPYTIGQGVALSLDASGSTDSDGTITLYEWDCTSDGSYDTSSASPTGSTCTYPDDGAYTVTLRVTDDDGAQATDAAAVTATNALPTADAGGPYTIGQGVALSLDASGSTDSDGTITLYEWDCTSDGSYDTSSASPTGSTCTYPDDGAYTVTLRVTDDDGAQATDTAAVTATNALPTADAGGPYAGNEGAAIPLDASGSSDSDGSITAYEWDCDANGVYELSSASPTGSSCTFGNEGSYTVGLRVTDDDGGQAIDTATVSVANVAPVLSNLVVPNGDEGSTLTFSVSASDVPGDTLVYTWDFGDGTNASGAVASHAYADDGAYSVSVTVGDGTTTSSLSGTATIANVAPAITSTAPTTATEGSVYSYSPAVSDPGSEVFLWTLSASAPAGMTVDSAGAISWTPTYDQAVVGSYGVVLTVDDQDGGTDVEAWTIAVSWLDSDGDGLPDGWETPNGLDPNDPTDATADPDGDGLTNSDEFAGGTDPNSFDGPTAPVAVSPVGALEVASLSPDLLVDNATDPQGDTLTYEFEVYSDASLTTLVTGMAGVAETAAQTEWKVDVVLLENTQYWWRARAEDGNAAGPWSSEESFVVNTANDLPETPILTWPVGGETVSVVSPTLLWQEVTDPDGDAVTYDVELRDETGAVIDSAIDIVGDGSEAEWTVSVVLDEDATYSWTARAVDDNGAAGPWAAEESFFVSTANGAPEGPVFTEPADGGSVASLSPSLVATEVTDPEGEELVYEFSVDTAASFDSADLVEATLGATGTGSVTWDLDIDGVVLPENGLVYARVRAVDPGGVASVPDTISFFVRGDNDAPTVPVLVAPADGSEVSGALTFEAEDPTDPEGDAVFVEFVLARDASLGDVLAETSQGIPVTGSGTTTWTPSESFGPGTYYWSARAVDAVGGESEWATPWSYTVPAENTGDDDDDDSASTGGGGCDCESSVADGATPAAWLLLLSLVPALRRRRS